MPTIAVAGTSGPIPQTWYTLKHDNRTTTTGSGKAVEKTNAATYPTAVKNPNQNVQRNLFWRKAGAAPKMCGVSVDIALEFKNALCTFRVPAHIEIRRLSYNEKGNLSKPMRIAATSGMLMPLHRELLRYVTRKCHPEIINIIGNHRW